MSRSSNFVIAALFALSTAATNAFAAECPSSIRYANGSPLKNNNFYYYANGSTLRTSGGTVYYPGGQIMRSGGSTIYYPNGNLLQTGNGTINYPNGSTLQTNSGTIYYSTGSVLKSNNGTFYYADGKTARTSGGTLYNPDGTRSNWPVTLTESVGEFGTLTVTAQSSSHSVQLALPRLIQTSEVTSFALNSNGSPIGRMELTINSGRPGQDILLSVDGNSATCVLRGVGGPTTFTVSSRAGTANVTINAGYDATEVRARMQELLDELE